MVAKAGRPMEGSSSFLPLLEAVWLLMVSQRGVPRHWIGQYSGLPPPSPFLGSYFACAV